MEALLGVAAVPSHLNIKGLRKLHDMVEAHVRGLRALGVPAKSYGGGGLLTLVLVNKLPPEIRLIVSTTGRWDLDVVMKILEREVHARERASSTGASTAPPPPPKMQPRTPTAAALVASNSGSDSGSSSCVYCGQSHMSSSCTIVTDVAARKDTLHKAGRCYICLQKHHRCKYCRSNISCRKCRGRHHFSICLRQSSQQGNTAPAPLGLSQGSSDTLPSSQGSIPKSTSTLYVGAQTPILLQTARLRLFKLSSGKPCIAARAIMDSGSQRTYITSRLRDQLNLSTMGTESLQIKTFGTTETHDTS